MMANPEIWQRLLSLESRDIVQQRFLRLHGRELNARRAREVIAAAKQAREYFRNASLSDYSVRPLLTFYGVASLSRALLLLLKVSGGEESLTPSHGLETISWSAILSGDPVEGIRNLGKLGIRTCRGLFTDFVSQTQNRTLIHINSSGIDWRIDYKIPELGVEMTIDDLFSRIPDLQNDYASVSNQVRYARIYEVTYTKENGFYTKVSESAFSMFRDNYEGYGYTTHSERGNTILRGDEETLEKALPFLIHTYAQKDFDAIPRLYLAEPFPSQARFSQLAVTYLVSYVLGMLVRYYPTHWILLSQGELGDRLWPTVNRAQNFVEKCFPDLVSEFIADRLENSKAITD